MENYFRIKGSIPDKNITFIMDSFGAFEKMWQFSSFLIQKGCKIIEVGLIDKFNTTELPPLQTKTSKMILRKIY